MQRLTTLSFQSQSVPYLSCTFPPSNPLQSFAQRSLSRSPSEFHGDARGIRTPFPYHLIWSSVIGLVSRFIFWLFMHLATCVLNLVPRVATFLTARPTWWSPTRQKCGYLGPWMEDIGQSIACKNKALMTD